MNELKNDISACRCSDGSDGSCPDRCLDCSRGSTAGSALLRFRPPRCEDEEFMALMRAYRRHGGLIRERDLQRQLGQAVISDLALSISWAGLRWYPTFQFLRQPFRLCPHAIGIMALLRPVFEDPELADWFVRPNNWLGQQQPLDMLNTAPARVLEAARTDRFVAGG